MNFGMFGGKENKVKIEFDDGLVGVIIDRFGKDITIRPSANEGKSETTIDVAVSDHFFGWLFALGTGVKIVSPKEVADRMKSELKNISDMY